MKFNKIIFTIFLLFWIGQCIAQPSAECSEGFSIKDKDYIIKFNGREYGDKDEAFICSSSAAANIPIEIWVTLSGGNETAVLSTSWNWGDGDPCKCVPSNPQSEIAFFNDSFWSNDNTAEVKVRFGESTPGAVKFGDDVGLKFKITKLDPLEINNNKTHNDNIHAFDENILNGYPQFNDVSLGTPIQLFIDDPVSTKELISIKKNKKTKDIELNADASKANILNGSNSNNSYIFNSTENSKKLEIENLNTGIEIENIILEACPDVPLTHADIYQKKEVNIEVYALCESDDDYILYDPDYPWLKADGTPITSTDFQCIHPGPDGSLDLYGNPTLYWNPDNDPNRPHDRIEALIEGRPSTRRVYASKDNSQPPGKKYFCNSKLKGSDDHDCIDMPNLSNIQSSLDDIFGPIGVKVNLINKGVIKRNFDVKNDDNILDIMLHEHLAFHGQEFGFDGDPLQQEYTAPVTTKMYIVPKIPLLSDGTPVGGVAMLLPIKGPKNVFFINNETINEDEWKFATAHEFGHARFGFWHIDSDDAVDRNGFKHRVTNDENFMLAIPQHKMSSVLQNRMRKYQWKTIHEKL